jgi:hypothetical protein
VIVVQFTIGASALIGMFLIGHHVTVAAWKRANRKWDADRARELAEAQRKALDSSLRWAYLRGVRDGMDATTETFDPHTGTVIAVADFRLQFGEDLGEVNL